MTPAETAFLTSQLSDLKMAIKEVHARIDKHAERTDRNFDEVKARQDKTNSRLSKLELWRAELRGAGRAMSWVPAVVIGVLSSATSLLLADLFLPH